MEGKPLYLQSATLHDSNRFLEKGIVHFADIRLKLTEHSFLSVLTKADGEHSFLSVLDTLLLRMYCGVFVQTFCNTFR